MLCGLLFPALPELGCISYNAGSLAAKAVRFRECNGRLQMVICARASGRKPNAPESGETITNSKGIVTCP